MFLSQNRTFGLFTPALRITIFKHLMIKFFVIFNLVLLLFGIVSLVLFSLLVIFLHVCTALTVVVNLLI